MISWRSKQLTWHTCLYLSVFARHHTPTFFRTRQVIHPVLARFEARAGFDGPAPGVADGCSSCPSSTADMLSVRDTIRQVSDLETDERQKGGLLIDCVEAGTSTRFWKLGGVASSVAQRRGSEACGADQAQSSSRTTDMHDYTYALT